MRAARSRGISTKRLNGWEPTETSTVTAWDDHGRPARWSTVREPEWDYRERSLALALDLYEAQLCPRCHQPLDDSMNPEHDPDVPEAPKAWTADGPDECHSCKVLARAELRWARDQQANVESGGEDSTPWTVHTPVLITKHDRPRQ